MRKRYSIPLALVIAALFVFFGPLPGWIEGSMNKLDHQPQPVVSAEALALHRTLQIVDLHSDTLMWGRELTQPASRGH